MKIRQLQLWIHWSMSTSAMSIGAANQPAYTAPPWSAMLPEKVESSMKVEVSVTQTAPPNED